MCSESFLRSLHNTLHACVNKLIFVVRILSEISEHIISYTQTI